MIGAADDRTGEEKSMEQRSLGSTGLTVSALGFGCGAIGGLMVGGSFEEQTAAVRRAIEAGISYFDTAPSYGAGRSEENLGRVLAGIGAQGRVRVGTKLRLTTADLADPAEAVGRSVRESLARLGRESVDLLQLHNRVALASATDGGAIGGDELAAVAAAMRGLVREGLAGHVGFTGLGETEALRQAVSGGLFETVQSYFNALNPSAGYGGASGGSQDFAGLIHVAADGGLGVIAIRVMAAGAMVGHGERPRLVGGPGGGLAPGSDYSSDVERARRLEALAREAGLESTVELAFRFALAKGGVSTALVGFSDFEQLESAIGWAERGPLTEDVVRRVVASARA